MADNNSIERIVLAGSGNNKPQFGGGGSAIGLGDAGGSVTFYASPEIEESGSTNYIVVDDIRSPGSLAIWMGSPSRQFTINAKLISRTPDEARKNWKDKSKLEAWRMPTGNDAKDSSVPEIITLSGYGNNFFEIPTIIRNLNISYPTDIDYISIEEADVPIIWPISITLLEYHTMVDMNNFNYASFKSGTFVGWS